MTKKLYRTILAVGIAVLALSTALFCWALLPHFTAMVYDELEQEAAMAARGVALAGEDYLSSLPSSNRFTWVDSDGTILFDSQADPAAMPNHLEREEIRQALLTGSGHSSRWSDTLSSQTLYYALRLSDGTVLRLASQQSSVAALVLDLAPALVVIVLLTTALASKLASYLSLLIIQPIRDLDLRHPESCPADTYEELAPLLTRLRSQNSTIRSQMEELQRQNEEFAAISENMSEGFLLLDSRTKLLSCNHSALRLLQAEDARPGCSALQLSRDPAFLRVVDQALSGLHSEALMERDGKIYQLLGNCVLREGRVAGAVVAILDVTERESRESLRREFTANVSHELKTPLTSISGFAELMKEGLVAADTVPEFAGDIYREAQRLIALVEDIIHLSQLDEGKLTAGEADRHDLAELAESTLARLAPAAEKAGVTLVRQGESASVTGQRSLLEELAGNLVDNAIKYNRPGGRVTVTTGLREGKPFLCVADTGIGIPPAHQQRVFERFYRVDKSHSRQVGGTGLGLSIVKHAAAALGAAVELESREGVGTTVTVRWQ